MKSELKKIEESNYIDVLKEIEEAFFEIPFGNSKFQTEAFVISAEITPERAYRSIGLQLLNSIRTMQELSISIKEKQIDLEEIEYKLEHGNLNEFDARREELKKLRIEKENFFLAKMVNDSLKELNLLYSHFKKFPKYTGEQFEEAESRHYDQRLNRQALGLEGAPMSLLNMREDLKAFLEFEEKIEKLGNNTLNQETFRQISNSMTNLLRREEKK